MLPFNMKKNLSFYLVLVICFFACAAIASTSTSTNEEKLIANVSGVYKNRFESEFLVDAYKNQHEKYVAENILEIVPYSKNEFYFRTHLEFYGGIVRGLSGIAKYTGKNTFFYQTNEVSETCNFQIIFKEEDIEFTYEPANADHTTCTPETSGPLRGKFFKRNEKRAIKYMPRLLASEKYMKAIKEHDEKLEKK